MKKALLLFWAIFMSIPCLHAQLAFYEHYAVHDELLVALAEGYRLDSVTRVDVVLIQAKDSAAWEWLKEEFQLEKLNDKKIERLQNGGDVRFYSIVTPQSHPVLAKENEDGVFIMAGSHKERALCIFFTHTEEQRKIICQNQIQIIKNKNR